MGFVYDVNLLSWQGINWRSSRQFWHIYVNSLAGWLQVFSKMHRSADDEVLGMYIFAVGLGVK